MDKQRVVEHDQLVQEFEELTTDPDGLLGVLEDTLQEYGDEASFEAKKLLCALFQVATRLNNSWNKYCTFLELSKISIVGIL